MNQNFRTALCLLATSLFLSGTLFAAPDKSEAELLQMLQSSNHKEVIEALIRLPGAYPDSTNAIRDIRQLLRTNDFTVARSMTSQGIPKKGVVAASDNEKIRNRVSRKAARALGIYHATLEPDEIDIICRLLHDADTETVIDGLKALRYVNASGAVPKIVPLLQSDQSHVVRDACRTLAVIGDKSVIPEIAPLLQHKRKDIKKDAAEAIAILNTKP